MPEFMLTNINMTDKILLFTSDSYTFLPCYDKEPVRDMFLLTSNIVGTFIHLNKDEVVTLLFEMVTHSSHIYLMLSATCNYLIT